MRTRREWRWSAVAIAVLVSGAACGAGSHDILSGPFAGPCEPKPAGGALCVDVRSAKGSVADVLGYLSSSASPLAGKHWRLVLSSYSCDPGTGAAPTCAATASYPGPTRDGPPPIESDCRRWNGTTETTSKGCHNTLAQETATFGDWSGFPLPDRPYVVQAKTWLCISEQVRSAAGWSTPTVATTPLRACSAVSPG